MARWTVFPEGEEPPKAAAALAEQVESDGGRALALYREPVGQHWQIFCLLPAALVEATPYQRDLSPTHVKRLQECVKKINRFVDPIVAMSPDPGRVLDAQRQSPAHRAGEAQGQDGARHPGRRSRRWPIRSSR